MFLSTHFFSLSRSLWMAVQPFGLLTTHHYFILSASLLCLIIQVINEDVKQHWPQCQTLWYPTSEWLASSWTSCQQYFESSSSDSFLSTSLSTYIVSYQQFVFEDVMGDSAKSFAEVKINNIHCSPIIHWASHLTVKGYWVDQAWSSLCKSMLANPNHFLVLSIFRNGFQ